MKALSRRALALGAVGLSAGEALSLAGTFDHRHATAAPATARERTRAFLAEKEACGVVHVGHSTHLLCVGGRRLLTDPWFYDPAFGALAHARAPACEPDDLVGLDAILVSHEHPDHADLVALDRFPEKRNVTVLLGTEALAAKLRRRGYRNVRVLSTWETHELGGARVHAVPALHDVPEVGFVVADERTSVYFAGDTARQPAFGEIRERLRPTFAILPVDGTRLRGSSAATMTADEAAHAARELGVTGAMPSHDEARFTDPVAEHVLTTQANGGAERFRREMARLLPSVRCELPAPGMPVAV